MSLRIGFIGGGKMAACLVGGLIHQGYSPENIAVADHHRDKAAQLEKEWQIHTYPRASDLLGVSDVIVLAVKPLSMQKTLVEIAPYLTSQLIISIVTGITIAQIQDGLNRPEHPVIRAMPNTPALCGVGITGLFASHVSPVQRSLGEQLFQSVGDIVWLEKEEWMHIVTALSGSGPAYFFYMMECLCQSAERMGLPREIASKLTLNTAIGSATMALSSAETLSTLRHNVTSKGGTTEQAISVLKNAKLDEILERALSAACEQSKRLSEQFWKC